MPLHNISKTQPDSVLLSIIHLYREGEEDDERGDLCGRGWGTMKGGFKWEGWGRGPLAVVACVWLACMFVVYGIVDLCQCTCVIVVSLHHPLVRTSKSNTVTYFVDQFVDQAGGYISKLRHIFTNTLCWKRTEVVVNNTHLLTFHLQYT